MQKLAKDWVQKDCADAFPEVPPEVIAQFAEGHAPRTVEELSRPLSPLELEFLYGDGTDRKMGLI